MHWFPDNVGGLPPFSHAWLAVLSIGIIAGITAGMMAVSMIFSRELPSATLTAGTVAIFIASCMAVFYVWQFQLGYQAEPVYAPGNPTLQEMENELARLNAELYQLVLRGYVWKSVMTGIGLGATFCGYRLMRERLMKYSRIAGIGLAAVGAGTMCGVVEIMLSA